MAKDRPMKFLCSFLVLLMLCACGSSGEQSGTFSGGKAPKQSKSSPNASAFKSGQKLAPKLSSEDQELLLQSAALAVQDVVKGKLKKGGWNKKFDKIDNRAYVILRLEGDHLGSYYTREDNLEHTVYNAVVKNIKNNKIALDEAANADIHIQVFGKYEPFDEVNYQGGLHGIRVSKGNKGANYSGSYAIESNYKLKKLKKKICLKAGLEEACWLDSEVEKWMFRYSHFSFSPKDDRIVNYYRGTEYSEQVNFDLSAVSESLNLAENWLTSNMLPDGAFPYVYNPSSGKYSENNNMIRQLMGSRQLAEMSTIRPELQAKHKSNLQKVFADWYVEENGEGYILFKEKSKLGAIALALRAICYSPFYNQYENKAKALFKTIKNLSKADGSFSAWKIAPDYDFDEDYLLTFYSGEAVLALLEYYEKSGNPEVLELAQKAQDYYVKKYVDEMRSNYYPAYVPWHTQSLHALYRITKDEKYAKAALTLNDELIKIQNTSGQPSKDFLGRFYSPDHPQYGSPHSASDGVYVEGLAYAYELAEWLGDEARMQKYRAAIEIGAHNLMNLQYKDESMYFLEYPERVQGALRFRVDDNRIRIDTTQHMMDAFRKILQIFAS